MFVDIAVCHAREPASGSPSVSYVCTSRVPPATSIIARGQRLYCTSDVWAPANNAGCHLSLPPSSRTRHGFLFHTLSHTTSRRVYRISVMVAFDRSPCVIRSTAILTRTHTSLNTLTADDVDQFVPGRFNTMRRMRQRRESIKLVGLSTNTAVCCTEIC